MKKIFDNKFLNLIICLIIFSVGVYAGRTYPANEIEYSSDKTEVKNVEDALNELYKVNEELIDLKSKGDATAEDITAGKKAIVNGKEIIGTKIDKNDFTITLNGNSRVYWQNDSRAASGSGILTIKYKDGTLSTSGNLGRAQYSDVVCENGVSNNSIKFN